MQHQLDIDKIRIDGGTQMRVEIDEATVTDYAERLEAGKEFPACIVFFDGSTHWLADGFHRYHAHKRAEINKIVCIQMSGDLRAAILYACGANDKHGKRRTNADKRRAVETLLNDPEWGKWSSREIAKSVGVSHTFVDSHRILTGNVASENQKTPEKRTFTDRYGNESMMNTAKIGKGKSQPEPVETTTIDDDDWCIPDDPPIAEQVCEPWDEYNAKLVEASKQCESLARFISSIVEFDSGHDAKNKFAKTYLHFDGTVGPIRRIKRELEECQIDHQAGARYIIKREADAIKRVADARAKKG
jgi:hypothetical protein